MMLLMQTRLELQNVTRYPTLPGYAHLEVAFRPDSLRLVNESPVVPILVSFDGIEDNVRLVAGESKTLSSIGARSQRLWARAEMESPEPVRLFVEATKG